MFILSNRDCGDRTADLQHSCCKRVTQHMKACLLCVRAVFSVLTWRLFWSVPFTLTCFFSFIFFCLFCFVFLLFSPVVCENREESRSWFQYLWRHQWPGEPLQTLWYGTTRPSLPASHSLPGFSSELPWKLLLITAVFCQSVPIRVCLRGSSSLG